MIGDSLIDQANKWSDPPNPLFLAQELCDPVEDDSLAYSKNGVMVSDFVTPKYFVPGSAGPWDFGEHLSAKHPGDRRLPAHMGPDQRLAATACPGKGNRTGAACDPILAPHPTHDEGARPQRPGAP